MCLLLRVLRLLRRGALLALLLVPALFLLVACNEGENPPPGKGGDVPAPGGAPAVKKVFDSPLAGTWYPEDPTALRTQLSSLFEAAKGETLTDVRALVLPHAGYRWSGAVAALGAKQVAGRPFTRVLVMGPSHHLSLENVVSLPNVTHYATPLGEVPLDVDFLAALRRHREFQNVPAAHANEHSVQIEVPLLQHALGSFQLVPLVVGTLDRTTARRVADILLSLVDDDTLVVASSDFTHYGPRFGYVPFTDDLPRKLRDLDMGTFATIERHDADAFVDYVESTGTTVCGRSAIEILLRMLPPETRISLLSYDTSGRIGGDWRNSVSYMSIAFGTSWPEREEPTVEAPTASLTLEEKAALLRMARVAITRALEGRPPPTLEDMGIERTPALERPRGAFVTLRHNGDLRGCIGEIHPSRPLWRAVMGTAIGSALRDRRFVPVTASELADIEISVSALTAPRTVASWKDIVLGKHGIVLEKHGRAATFLPQVAPEQEWDLDQTLTRLAMKAGLASDAWYQGATFLVFEAEVFGEKDE